MNLYSDKKESLSSPDQQRLPILSQLKKLSISPYISALPAHVDRHVTHNAYSSGVGVALHIIFLYFCISFCDFVWLGRKEGEGKKVRKGDAG
jgi:hypothetical protein